MLTRILLFFCLLSHNLLSGQDFSFITRAPSTPIQDLETPFDAVSNSAGHVFISDSKGAFILEMDQAGNNVDIHRTFSSASGQIRLQEPTHLFIDSEDKLYVYDKGAGKIIVRDTDGSTFAFGESGTGFGQLSKVQGIVADSQGFVYVLNGASKRVDVFQADGSYRTFLTGGFDPFQDPLDIGINGKNEIYVLESKGPAVILFDSHGNQTSFHREFTGWDGVEVENPTALTVLANGDFFVLDRKSSKITRFSRQGSILGNFGGQGDGSSGTFASPIALSSNNARGKTLVVLDKGVNAAQVFMVGGSRKNLKPDYAQVRVLEQQTDRPPVIDLAVSLTGTRFAIPSKRAELVVAYADTSNTEQFVLNNNFKGAVDLEIDKASQLYVVDRQGKEVSIFDDSGVLIRKLGKDIPEKLKNPTSIAVQSNRHVVVCDQGAGNLHLWDENGLYQKVITSAKNSVLETPSQISVDSKDRIYIWDSKTNSIYRTGSNGWPIAPQILQARPSRVEEAPGNISGFFIDEFDKIYLFNKTNRQIEVYHWDVEPKLEFSFGYNGTGVNGLKNIENIVFDPSSYRIYCSGKSESDQKVMQLLVAPPAPDPNVTYRVTDGKLQIGFIPLYSPLVTGYGLLTKDMNGEDSLAVETTFNILTIDESNYDELKPRHYEFVSLSTSDRSSSAMGFDNHLGYADRLQAATRYEDALSAYQKALFWFGDENGVPEYVTSQLMSISKTLKTGAEVGRAVPFMEKAYFISPQNEAVRQHSQEIITAYFTELANQDDVAGILFDAELWQGNVDFRPIVHEAMNALCMDLGKVQNERSVDQAIVLGKTMRDWGNQNADHLLTLARNCNALFKLKSLKGVPSFELESLINEAVVFAAEALQAMKQSGQPDIDAQILELEVLNSSARFMQASEKAVEVLTKSNAQMSGKQTVAIRRELAKSYTGQELHAQAALEYRRLIELEPTSEHFNNLLAMSLMRVENLEEAETIYRRLVEKNKDAFYIGQLGRIELLKGNYAEASFQIEKALAQDPTNISLFGPLAEAYEGASNYQLALKNYKLAAQHQRSNIASARNRVTSFEMSSQLQKQLIDYLLKVAELNGQLGLHTDAILVYQDAIAIDATRASSHFGLGNAALKAGLIYDAINAFAEARSLDSSNQIYQQEYDNAMKIREEVKDNESALSILDVKLDGIFPSLYQNYADIRLLPVGRIILANNSNLPITPTGLSVHIPELMDQPTQIKPPAMVGYSNMHLDLSAIFNPRILEETQDRSLQMEIEISYNMGGEAKTVSTSSAVLIHGRNKITWSDKRRLAAFVATPVEELVDFDKEMDRFFDSAPRYGQNTAILQAIQTYTMLHSSGYVYSPDPVQSFSYVSSHTETMDFLQYPAETMKRKSGDCDDLVALYSSLLENAGIATAYIDVPGHVFMAFDSQIRPSDLGNSGLEHAEVIEFQDKVWIPIETTLIGKHGFMTAWKDGAAKYYTELNRGHFPELVPLAEARNVYHPSSYIPEGFTARPSTNERLMDAYNAQVIELLTKVNRVALENLESRYQTEAGNVFVKNKYACLLAQLGQENKSERILAEALEISPQNPVLLNNLGNVNLLMGDAEDAIYYYSVASELDKTDGEILINLCKAHLMAGEKQEAAIAFDRAVSIDVELKYLYDELKIELQ